MLPSIQSDALLKVRMLLSLYRKFPSHIVIDMNQVWMNLIPVIQLNLMLLGEPTSTQTNNDAKSNIFIIYFKRLIAFKY